MHGPSAPIGAAQSEPLARNSGTSAQGEPLRSAVAAPGGPNACPIREDGLEMMGDVVTQRGDCAQSCNGDPHAHAEGTRSDAAFGVERRKHTLHQFARP